MSENKEANEILDRFKAKEKKNEDFLEKDAELKADYITALNGVVSTPNGKHFLKVLVNYLDLHNFKQSLEPRDMFLERGKKQVYLELIRPYLETEVRKEIE